MAEPYVGEIRMFAGNYTIRDWIQCDGRLLSISQYDVLYALLGTTYGGDGISTFAVPDLRSRIPIHFGTGTGLSPYQLGEQRGTEHLTLSVNNLPIHSHTLTVSTEAGTSNTPASTNYFAATATPLLYGDTQTTAANLNPGVVTPVGGNIPIDITMPYLVINFLISPYGIFPPQN